jgi:hypothetical protein
MEKKSETLTSCTAGSRVLVAVASIMPMAIRAAIWARPTGLVTVLLRGSGHGGVVSGQGEVVRHDCFRGDEGSIWHHFFRSGIVVCAVVDGKRIVRDDKAFNVVVRVFMIGTLLPFSGAGVGVGVNERIGLDGGRVEATVRSGVLDGLIVRGTVIGVGVEGGVIVVVQGNGVILTANHERDTLCRLLLDRWDELIHDRVEDRSASCWGLNRGCGTDGRSEQGGQYRRSKQGARR